jgi:hypothetical protein
VLAPVLSEMSSEHARLASLAARLASASRRPEALVVAEGLRTRLAAHLDKDNELLLFRLCDEGRVDLADLIVDIHYATNRVSTDGGPPGSRRGVAAAVVY